MKPIRIALTKGRLEKKSVSLFQTMGLHCDALLNKGRRLILPMEQYEVVLAKSVDVVTYVRHGSCDIGIVGKDTVAENGDGVYEVMTLPFGKCRFALAGPADADFYAGHNEKIVATKYPNVARAFFAGKGMDVNIIKIEGSVELAPLLGLSHAIVDIVETGNTLRDNGLVVIEDIMPVSARVIVNMASMKLRKEEVETFLQDVELAKEVSE